MRAQCKAFTVRSALHLERQFNEWHEEMERSVPGFVIVQSHLSALNDDEALLVVFWVPAPAIERGATQ